MGLTAQRAWIRDKSVAPDLHYGLLSMQYVANFASLGTSSEQVREDCEHMESQLRSEGLVTHDRSKASQFNFGVCGVMKPSAGKFWQLILGPRYVLQQSLLTGKELVRLIGHWP